MNYKINEVCEKNKLVSLEKIREFFTFGLQLGVFKVSGNEGTEIIYENTDIATNASPTVLLNEVEKDKPQPVAEVKPPAPVDYKSTRAAPVGNSVSSGFKDLFAGTSWGK